MADRDAGILALNSEDPEAHKARAGLHLHGMGGNLGPTNHLQRNVVTQTQHGEDSLPGIVGLTLSTGSSETQNQVAWNTEPTSLPSLALLPSGTNTSSLIITRTGKIHNQQHQWPGPAPTGPLVICWALKPQWPIVGSQSLLSPWLTHMSLKIGQARQCSLYWHTQVQGCAPPLPNPPGLQDLASEMQSDSTQGPRSQDHSVTLKGSPAGRNAWHMWQRVLTWWQRPDTCTYDVPGRPRSGMGLISFIHLFGCLTKSIF